MGKQHIVAILGTAYLILSAINEYPKLKVDFWGYFSDMGLIVLVTFIILLLMYIGQK